MYVCMYECKYVYRYVYRVGRMYGILGRFTFKDTLLKDIEYISMQRSLQLLVDELLFSQSWMSSHV